MARDAVETARRNMEAAGQIVPESDDDPMDEDVREVFSVSRLYLELFLFFVKSPIL